MRSPAPDAGSWLEIDATAFESIKAGLRHDIEELVADPQSARKMHTIAAEAGKVVRIHLDINSSGISRHSLDVSSALGRASAVAIVSHPGLRLTGGVWPSKPGSRPLTATQQERRSGTG